MPFRANQQLREDIWDYRFKSPTNENDNAPRAMPPRESDYSTTALDLVQQAAEVFSGMQNHARETEARAQSMYKSFAEKLRRVEDERDAAERARRDVVREMNSKLQDVTKTLQKAHARIADAEDRATAAEFRAQATETQLHKANRELAAIEEAIRTRLL
jgi:flagellar hook-basal body complex protein FliE